MSEPADLYGKDVWKLVYYYYHLWYNLIWIGLTFRKPQLRVCLVTLVTCVYPAKHWFSDGLMGDGGKLCQEGETFPILLTKEVMRVGLGFKEKKLWMFNDFYELIVTSKRDAQVANSNSKTIVNVNDLSYLSIFLVLSRSICGVGVPPTWSLNWSGIWMPSWTTTTHEWCIVGQFLHVPLPSLIQDVHNIS